MKVEQENFLRPIFSSVQRLRRWLGTSRVIVWAKSELITSASALYSPALVRTPTALRPWNRISSTGSFRRMRTPISVAAFAIAAMTAPVPPRGWWTPNSYSMNDRIVNRLGQRNGDMPRYLLWNEKASRTLGSAK